MKILLVNVHSGLNLGDDGIMAATLHGLEQLFPSSQITIAANDPESWAHYADIHRVPSLCHYVADCRLGRWQGVLRRTPFATAFLLLFALFYRLTGWRVWTRDKVLQQLLPVYTDADLVLSCGGGNFYAERRNSPALFWNLMAIALPIWLGKPVIMLPQSIGPVHGRPQQLLTRIILQRVTLLMVREEISRRFVQEQLHVSAPVIQLPDLAYSMPPSAATASGRDHRGERLHLGITALDRRAQLPTFTNQARYEEALLHTIRRLVEKGDVEIYLYAQVYGPTENQDDRRLMRRLHQQLENLRHVHLAPRFSNAAAAVAAYAQLDGMIASRMHTGIFTLCSDVPTVLIGYQPKAQGMIQEYGLMDYHLHIDDVSPETLLPLVAALLRNREQLRDNIAAHNRFAADRRQLWQDYVKQYGQD